MPKAMDLLAAKVWTYWISFFIIVPVVLLVDRARDRRTW